MADGDRAAVDVVLVRVDAQLVTAVQALAGERFVQFPQADIVDGQTETLEQLRHREYRADAHLVRVTAGHGHAAVGAQGLQAETLGFLGFHQHAGAGAVGQLGGVTGGDELAFLDVEAVLEHRLQALQAFQGGLGAVALVLGQGHFLVGNFLGLFVHHLHVGGQGHDLVVELAFLLSLGGAHL